MEITFDPAKDVLNTAKHGVPLALALELEWGELLAQPDTRRDYGELRMIGYAPIGARVFCVVFTDRDDQRRIISLRKANAREVKRYASQI
ncbi:MAG: BrnT family toxin [Acidiferrobacter sp.]